VPYGNYNNPGIYTKKTINLASKLLQNVNITCQDYEVISKKLDKNDFIYLDPCYDPLTKKSFVSYTPDKFSVNDRIRLSKFMLKCRRKGVICILSNNNICEVRKLYRDFKVRKIFAPRFINRRGSNRGPITELIISSC